MFPFGDVIPTRTRPLLTGGLALAALALAVPAGLRPWTVAWLVDALLIWILGRTIEDRLGHARFALLAALGAAGAAAVAAIIGPAPIVLMAMGGVAAAVGGGYLARFPAAPVLVPVLVGVEIFEIPGWFVGAAWAVVHAALSLGASTEAATFAILAGLGAGAGLGGLLAWLLSRPERDDPAWWNA